MKGLLLAFSQARVHLKQLCIYPDRHGHTARPAVKVLSRSLSSAVTGVQSSTPTPITIRTA